MKKYWELTFEVWTRAWYRKAIPKLVKRTVEAMDETCALSAAKTLGHEFPTRSRWKLMNMTEVKHD